jgi:biotin-(acetyl-CoA carboxylase) ligase
MKRTIEETRKLIEDALAEMIIDGDKINVSAVARHVGINHSYIHNDFPDLKLKIDNAKGKQQSELKKISDTKVIERQKKQISSLKQHSENTDSNDSLEEIYSKMMETYRFHDTIKNENEDLKKRLIHGIDRVDVETGELFKLSDIKFK